MRIVLPLIALALTTAAAPAPPAQVEEGIPMRELQVSPDPALCRDRIHEVREERGLPLLNRENAAPDEPLMILAVDKRIVEKSGAWFAYSGERLGQGRENAKQYLKDNPSVRQAIEDRVRRDLGLVRDAAEVAAAAAS